MVLLARDVTFPSSKSSPEYSESNHIENTCLHCQVFYPTVNVIQWQLPNELSQLSVAPPEGTGARFGINSPIFVGVDSNFQGYHSASDDIKFNFTIYHEENDNMSLFITRQTQLTFLNDVPSSYRVTVKGFSSSGEVLQCKTFEDDFRSQSRRGWKDFCRWNAEERPGRISCRIDLMKTTVVNVFLRAVVPENLLFGKEKLADVAFQSADGSWEVHAHKSVLAMCSQYFLAMFGSGMTESVLNKDGKARVVLKDEKVDEETFLVLIEFLYRRYLETEETGTSTQTQRSHPNIACPNQNPHCYASKTMNRLLNLPIHTITNLAYLSDIYLLPSLTELCVLALQHHLHECLDLKNLEEIYSLADQLHSNLLVGECIAMMGKLEVAEGRDAEFVGEYGKEGRIGIVRGVCEGMYVDGEIALG
ncbi:hypothetical protein HK102_012129 [Quaeritorhiza haematococci]|nr:hypothetical protein HK102_012129 [Quaeritorhiza haematococci]